MLPKMDLQLAIALQIRALLLDNRTNWLFLPGPPLQISIYNRFLEILFVRRLNVYLDMSFIMIDLLLHIDWFRAIVM